MIHELRYFAQLHLFLEKKKCETYLLPSKMANILLNKSDEILEFDMKKEWFRTLEKMTYNEIVENNNGWIRIFSESDLPKESGDYLAVIFENEVIEVSYCNKQKNWCVEKLKSIIVFPTHYREKYKLPIY